MIIIYKLSRGSGFLKGGAFGSFGPSFILANLRVKDVGDDKNGVDKINRQILKWRESGDIFISR